MKRQLVPALLALVFLVAACSNAAVVPSTVVPELLALAEAEPGMVASIGEAIAISHVTGSGAKPVERPAALPLPVPLSSTTSEATPEATPEPTRTPTSEPTPTPSPEPTPAPTPKATPRATPRPSVATPRPSVATVEASFFGSGVKVSSYTVRGATSKAIVASMRANGPRVNWTGRAEALTKGSSVYRFHLETDGSGACRIVLDSKPAIGISISVVLPRWQAAAGTSAATVRWWNSELREVATHERVHVHILKAAVKRLRSVLATSSCQNYEGRLNKVWADVRRQNCVFDMKEYGTTRGMSLKACLAG